MEPDFVIGYRVNRYLLFPEEVLYSEEILLNFNYIKNNTWYQISTKNEGFNSFPSYMKRRDHTRRQLLGIIKERIDNGAVVNKIIFSTYPYKMKIYRGFSSSERREVLEYILGHIE